MSREYKKDNCVNCGEFKYIAAKGACRACYNRFRRNGTFEKVKVKNVCNIKGCDNFVVANGLCDKHRKRLSKHGHTNNTRPKDWGKREKHPLYKYWVDVVRRTSHLLSDEWFDDFWQFVEDVKERPENHHIRPKVMNKKMGGDNFIWAKGKVIKRNPARPKSTRKSRRSIYVSRQKRILMYEEANYKCQICGKHESKCDPATYVATVGLCIDHCHETMKLRGVLCNNCNKGIGHLKDSIPNLEAAIKYLKKHE